MQSHRVKIDIEDIRHIEISIGPMKTHPCDRSRIFVTSEFSPRRRTELELTQSKSRGTASARRIVSRGEYVFFLFHSLYLDFVNKSSPVITTETAARKYRKTPPGHQLPPSPLSLLSGLDPRSRRAYTCANPPAHVYVTSTCARRILEKHACPGSREAKVNERLLSGF